MKRLFLLLAIYVVISSNIFCKDEVTYIAPKYPVDGFAGFISAELVSYLKTEDSIKALQAIGISDNYHIESLVFKSDELQIAEKTGQSPCIHIRVSFKKIDSDIKKEAWIVPSLTFKENESWSWVDNKKSKFQFFSIEQSNPTSQTNPTPSTDK